MKSEQSRPETGSESAVDQDVGWCVHKQNTQGAKTSNPIKIISLSRKQNICLLLSDWPSFGWPLILCCCHVATTASAPQRVFAVSLRACRSYRSSGGSIVAVSLPRFINLGYNFGLCCPGRGGGSAVSICPKGGGTHFFHFLRGGGCGSFLEWPNIKLY